MKNKFFRALFPAAVLGLSIMLTACAANSSNASETTAASESIADSETSEAADAADGAAGEEDSSSDEWYSDRDMEQSPDTTDAQTIEVTDGETLTITEEGTYILQGLRQTARFWSMRRKPKCSSSWTM